MRKSLEQKIEAFFQSKEVVSYIKKGVELLQSQDPINSQMAFQMWIGAKVMYDYAAFLEWYYPHTYVYVKKCPPNWCDTNLKELMTTNNIWLSPSQLDLLAYSLFQYVEYRYLENEDQPLIQITPMLPTDKSCICEIETNQKLVIELPLAAMQMDYGQTYIENDEAMNQLIAMYLGRAKKQSKTIEYKIANKDDIELSVCNFYECYVYDIPITKTMVFGGTVDLSNIQCSHAIPNVSITPKMGATDLDLSSLIVDNLTVCECYYLKTVKMPTNIKQVKLDIMFVGGVLPSYIDDILNCESLVECNLNMRVDLHNIKIGNYYEYMMSFHEANMLQFFEYFYGAQYLIEANFYDDAEYCCIDLIKI